MLNKYNTKKIDIAKEVNTNLGMNYAAKSLFEKINKSAESSIAINFKDVIFMSRAFAQEYVYQKNKTNKKITEINKPSVYRDYIKNNLIGILDLEKEIYKKLGLETSAKKLFEKINSMPHNIIMLDFSNIEFISRAFAQEYVYQKNKTSKKVFETNKPKEVELMLGVVYKDFENK